MQSLHQPEDIVSDRYRIVAALGQGGIGTTYEAEDLTNYKRVAIKAVSLRQMSDWKVLELFEREARILANLNHPAIPKYLNYLHVDTPSDRRFYLVQELVGGSSLADLIQKGWHADESKVKQIASQVLSIIKYLHSLTPPVIHRDIKPQNIILHRDERVFLVDFGAVQDVYRYTISRGGTFVGTLGFMPPEQLKNKVVPASDLYSLGATLLFLLTHKWPDEFPQHRMKIDFRSQVQISDKFADWLEKMLEPIVEDRFYSAFEALQELQSSARTATRSPVTKPKPSGEENTTHQLKPMRSQPSYSRIVLKKTNKSLMVEIPPSGGLSLFIAVVTTSMTAPFLLGIIFEFITQVLFKLNFLAIVKLIYVFLGLLPFVFVSLHFFDEALYTRDYIEIDAKTCCLRRQGFYPKSKVEFPTKDIALVEVRSGVIQGTTMTALAIWEGVHPHHCSSRLSQEEQEWLAVEISDFLEQMR